MSLWRERAGEFSCGFKLNSISDSLRAVMWTLTRGWGILSFTKGCVCRNILGHVVDNKLVNSSSVLWLTEYCQTPGVVFLRHSSQHFGFLLFIKTWRYLTNHKTSRHGMQKALCNHFLASYYSGTRKEFCLVNCYGTEEGLSVESRFLTEMYFFSKKLPHYTFLFVLRGTGAQWENRLANLS